MTPFDLKNVLNTDQKSRRESDRKRRMKANLAMRSNSRSNNILANQTDQKNKIKQPDCREIKLELNESITNDYKS